MHTYQEVVQKEIFSAASEDCYQEEVQLKGLKQMYPVYKTDLSVSTEIEQLPSLPESPTAARI